MKKFFFIFASILLLTLTYFFFLNNESEQNQNIKNIGPIDTNIYVNSKGEELYLYKIDFKKQDEINLEDMKQNGFGPMFGNVSTYGETTTIKLYIKPKDVDVFKEKYQPISMRLTEM